MIESKLEKYKAMFKTLVTRLQVTGDHNTTATGKSVAIGGNVGGDVVGDGGIRAVQF